MFFELYDFLDKFYILVKEKYGNFGWNTKNKLGNLKQLRLIVINVLFYVVPNFIINYFD